MIVAQSRILALTLFLACAPARAVRPLALPAPDFPKGLVWLNSPELSLRGLRDRNVLVAAFISISAPNSLRIIPKLEAWSKRYAAAGLIVIAIHTPDFELEKDRAVVQAELQRLGVSIPVVLDNERTLWKAYGAQGWPSLFLVDPKGRIVFDRLGEGRSQEFEIEIIDALERFNGYSPKGYWPAPDPVDSECGKVTRARYFGAARGQVQPLGTERGRVLVGSRDGELAYKGKWTATNESLRSQRASHDGSDFVRLIYRGAAAMAFARAGGKPVPVYVKQDEFWLNERNAGADVRFDKGKRSFFLVSAARFYNVSRNPSDDVHELVLYPAAPGLEIYAFDFANTCQDRASR